MVSYSGILLIPSEIWLRYGWHQPHYKRSFPRERANTKLLGNIPEVHGNPLKFDTKWFSLSPVRPFRRKCNVDWRVQAFEHCQVHAFCKCLSFTHPNPNSSFSFRWTELVQLDDEYDEFSSCKNMQLISTYSKAYIAMWYHVFISDLTFDQVHLCLRFWVIFMNLGFSSPAHLGD